MNGLALWKITDETVNGGLNGSGDAMTEIGIASLNAHY